MEEQKKRTKKDLEALQAEFNSLKIDPEKQKRINILSNTKSLEQKEISLQNKLKTMKTKVK